MFELTPFVNRHNQAVYNPFAELENFGRDFFRGSDLTSFKTDIKDNGNAYELEAELPGFKKDDIHVDLDQNYMTISAQRSENKEERDKKGNYVRRERSYGSFSRSFDVSGIDVSAITATYDNGILKLTLPKQSETAPSARRLEIQ